MEALRQSVAATKRGQRKPAKKRTAAKSGASAKKRTSAKSRSVRKAS
jgi:hypothetical protein